VKISMTESWKLGIFRKNATKCIEMIFSFLEICIYCKTVGSSLRKLRGNFFMPVLWYYLCCILFSIGESIVLNNYMNLSWRLNYLIKGNLLSLSNMYEIAKQKNFTFELWYVKIYNKYSYFFIIIHIRCVAA